MGWSHLFPVTGFHDDGRKQTILCDDMPETEMCGNGELGSCFSLLHSYPSCLPLCLSVAMASSTRQCCLASGFPLPPRPLPPSCCPPPATPTSKAGTESQTLALTRTLPHFRASPRGTLCMMSLPITHSRVGAWKIYLSTQTERQEDAFFQEQDHRGLKFADCNINNAHPSKCKFSSLHLCSLLLIRTTITCWNVIF